MINHSCPQNAQLRRTTLSNSSLTSDGREQRRCLDIIHGFGQQIVREKMAERRKSQSDSDNNNTETAPGETVPKKRRAFLDGLAELADQGVLTEVGSSQQSTLNVRFQGQIGCSNAMSVGIIA